MYRVGFGVTVLERAQRAGGLDGIGTYTNELSRQFSKLDHQISIHPFTVGTSKLNRKSLKNDTFVISKSSNVSQSTAVS